MPTYRRQAVVVALSGGMLLIPPIGAHAGWTGSTAWIIAAALGLLLAVLSWLNLRLMRESDEFSRAVINQSNAVAFWTLQLAFFVWAALAKLELAGEINSWTALTIMMAVYLVISTVVSLRRGLVAV